MARAAGPGGAGTASRAWRVSGAQVIPPAPPRLPAAPFKNPCRLITAANDREMPELPPTVAYQLSRMVADEALTSVKRSIEERSVTCFQSKEELLQNDLYRTSIVCSSMRTGKGKYDMTTMADVRIMALLYDALVEEEMAGRYGLEPGNVGMAGGAAMIRIPPRTAAVTTAIAESGFSYKGRLVAGAPSPFAPI